MSGIDAPAIIIRPEEPRDEAAIALLVERAFGSEAEARLVDALRRGGYVALSLVAERSGALLGHVLFSRLAVEKADARGTAVALAPVAIDPGHQRRGIGRALIEESHARLAADGVSLSVVLGDPAYYGRLGYDHARAAGFGSDYQGEALQALVLRDDAPSSGRLVYAAPFSDL